MVIHGFEFNCSDTRTGSLDRDRNNKYIRVHDTCIRTYVKSRIDEQIIPDTYTAYIDRLMLDNVGVDDIIITKQEYQTEKVKEAQRRIAHLDVQIKSTSLEIERMLLFSSTEMDTIIRNPAYKRKYHKTTRAYKAEYAFLNSLSTHQSTQLEAHSIPPLFARYFGIKYLLDKLTSERLVTTARMQKFLDDKVNMRTIVLRREFIKDENEMRTIMDIIAVMKEISSVIVHRDQPNDASALVDKLELLIASINKITRRRFAQVMPGAKQDVEDILEMLQAGIPIENVREELDDLFAQTERAPEFGLETNKTSVFEASQIVYNALVEQHDCLLKEKAELELMLPPIEQNMDMEGGRKYRLESLHKISSHVLQNKTMRVQKPIYKDSSHSSHSSHSAHALFVRYKSRYILVSEYQYIKRLKKQHWRIMPI